MDLLRFASCFAYIDGVLTGVVADAHAPTHTQKFSLPNGSIVEVGTPRNIMKLRIIGMETSLEKKGARYIVEYEDGKRVSMLILPADIQSVMKP